MRVGRPKGAKDSKPRKRRTDNPVSRMHEVEVEEGYNTRTIQFMMELMPTEPLDKHDVPEMKRRFQRYLELCAKYDKKPANLAAYTAIGIDMHEAADWSHQISNPERTTFIKTVMKICSMYREGLMADGKVNPVVGIFWQKNYDGFKDQQEVVVAPQNPLGETQDVNALKARYLEQLPEGKQPPELPTISAPPETVPIEVDSQSSTHSEK